MNVYKSSTADIRSLRTLIREHGLGHTLPQRAQTHHAVAPTGIEQLDIRLGGGLLRGAICEVIGPCSSGRTGLLLAALARCTRAGEIAAYVDATDCLDQRSAEQAGVELEKLLWIRCNAEGRLCGQQGAWGHAPSDDAWQAANLIAAAGGFGVVAVDLGGLSERQLGRWQKRAWMRLKHAVEGSSTTLAVLAERHVAGSAADMVLRLQRERTAWEGLLEGIGLQVEVVKDRAHRADGKLRGGRMTARVSGGRAQPASLYASLYVPDFSVAVLQRGELRPDPTAVVCGQSPNRFVYAADAGVRRCGVRVGMVLAAAQARYASAGKLQPLRIFDRDEREEQRAQGLLLELAEKATPRFEEAAPGVFVLDFKGLGDPYATAGELASGAAELGLKANVGVSMNRLVALSAARTQPGVTHVYPGQEEGFLQALPLDTLPLDDGELKILNHWGLRTVGELAQLPPERLSERFGERGACMARLARGKESSTLRVYQPPARLEVSRDFDWEIASLDPLMLAMTGMLEQLCIKLHGLDRAAGGLTTRLRLADGGELERTIELPSPLSDARVLLTLVRIDLAAHPPPAAVEGAYVSARPVECHQTQRALFGTESASPERMAVMLARLGALVGKERFGAPSVPDTYRSGVAEMKMFRPVPERAKARRRAAPGRALAASETVAARSSRPAPARAPTPPRASLVFRCYRPSHPARVILREDRPARFEAQGVRGPVTACAGPWHVSGEWWTPDGWQYQEWDVEVAGGLYRACCERTTGEWFLVESTTDPDLGAVPGVGRLRMYVELHSASGFSFLEGASDPEDLVGTAASLGHAALALCDRDSVSGAPRLFQAARAAGVRALVGCEISLEQQGVKKGTPNAILDRRLAVLVQSRAGYRNLCRLLTRMNLRAPKGEGRARWQDVEEYSAGLVALLHDLRDEDAVRGIFGPGNVYVELQRHLIREQECANRARVEFARAHHLPLLATNGVRYDTADRKHLSDALTCLRFKRKLDNAGRLLDANAERCLKSSRQMERLFADLPEAVAETAELGQRLSFTLEDLGYEFPRYPLPPGETAASYLREQTLRGAAERYRGEPHRAKALRQIDHELAVIRKLALEGYFLIVWDLVEFARRSGILCQGRGSAANSAVCYALGITAVDPVKMDLLFERFLSEERGEWPDIDLDLPSGEQRERVIQHVYARYGERGAAMTANVITYRGRSAVRETGKVLGFPDEMVGELARSISRFEYLDSRDGLFQQAAEVGLDRSDPRVVHWLRLCLDIRGLPRHLGQHSGGMVVCQGDLDAVVPLENARMQDRVVVQWDKEDCADLGIVKVDLLGLGMMAVLEEATATIRSRGGRFDMARLPAKDSKTYQMIQRADTVGVFQIESRAQMATLPRIRPACFYDLVVEVAIIRPGPITGNMVHPYINRRLGREPVRYPHPSLEPILKRTLGVPLFQEQLLRMAMTAAGFTGGQAEQLRRAMGFKRSVERMDGLQGRLRQGLARNGIAGAAAAEIVKSITSFALYGFPESHSASFAQLAYASSYLKAHYPAEFLAALLNCQPMGFYSPAVLVKDAQRHGVRVLPIDVNASDVRCTVVDLPAAGTGSAACVRLGLAYVRELRPEAAAKIVADRTERSDFRSIGEFSRRVRLHKNELDTLAEIGALNSLGDGLHRREAMWQVEGAWRPKGPLFDAQDDSLPEPGPLAPMEPLERLESDYRGAGLTVGKHPMHYLRGRVASAGVLSSRDLEATPNGQRVRAAGAVITRQRPGTAKGFCFVTLEDELGVANLILTPQVFHANRFTVMHEPFLLAEGVLQNAEGTVSVKVDSLKPLIAPALGVQSHDFH